MPADRRSYPQSDIKKLWGESAGRCAFPRCKQKCVIDETEFDEKAIIGKIAHIFAHSDIGPRANPNLTRKERDSYSNWILLCGTHHDLVDIQSNTYTAENLLRWKTLHKEWVDSQLQNEMTEVSYAELEVVAQKIIGDPFPPFTSFELTPPNEKMERNQLTNSIRADIISGMVKAKEVEAFIHGMVLLDRFFPERLRAGFITRYDNLKATGLNGDELFLELWELAAGRSMDFRRRAAGLAILVYLFQVCDVFEP